MRFDAADYLLNTFHHLGELELGFRLADAKLLAARDMRHELGRSNHRLRRYATEIEAIAAHLVLFDQGHASLDGGGNIGGDQARRTGADDHQVGIETIRFAKTRQRLARRQQRHQLAADKWQYRQQQEGKQYFGTENFVRRLDLAELGAGVDIDRGAGQHAELADPEKSPQPQAGQSHYQVDDEKRECRHQAQGKKIKRAVLVDAVVYRFQRRAEAGFHHVAKQVTRHQEGNRSTDGAGKRHQHETGEQPEDRARGQRHHGRARQ